MRLFTHGWLIVSALALAAPAAAQDRPQEADPSEIVVEGTKDRERQVRDFVGALTKAPIGGQLSRFDWAVCPAALGLPDVQNRALVARMRQVAEAARIPLAAADCKPNVLVLVTADRKGLIEALRRAHPAYFTGLSEEEVRKLASGKGRAAAWQVEGVLSADGTIVPRDAVTGQYKLEITDVPSRLTNTVRPHFLASLLVVEIEALSGLTTTQLADYAAMRTFARTEPSRLDKAKAATILSVLDAPIGAPVPLTLTSWDLGFLKGLYGAPENAYANQQRSSIRSEVEKSLDKAKGEKN